MPPLASWSLQRYALIEVFFIVNSLAPNLVVTTKICINKSFLYSEESRLPVTCSHFQGMQSLLLLTDPLGRKCKQTEGSGGAVSTAGVRKRHSSQFFPLVL